MKKRKPDLRTKVIETERQRLLRHGHVGDGEGNILGYQSILALVKFTAISS